MANNLTIVKHQVRITVLKKHFHREFVDKYAAEPERWTECSHFEVGQQFVTALDAPWDMPEGFCGWAWEDLRKDRYLLAFGGDIPDTEEGVVYVSCSDGKRPVVFKLERLANT